MDRTDVFLSCGRGDDEPFTERLYSQPIVFPPSAPVPESAVLTLWTHSAGLSEGHGRRVLAKLHNRALIRLDGAAPHRRVSMHDLQRDYLRGRSGDGLATLNRTLLEAYAQKSPAGWSSGPNDGYFFQYLAHHLVVAERTAELLDLLCSTPVWVKAKLAAVGDPMACVDDIDAAWRALRPGNGPDDLASRASLKAVRQVLSAWSNRDDLEVEILVKLGRSAEALSSVRGRADPEARFDGLMVIDAALREAGREDAVVTGAIESTARVISAPEGVARSLAQLARRVQDSDAERSRALLEEAFALTMTLPSPSSQVDVLEFLGPSLHGHHDERLTSLLDSVEQAVRTLAVDRDRAKALGRLALVRRSVGDHAHATPLLQEVQQLASRLTGEGDITLFADLGLYGITFEEATAAESDAAVEPCPLDDLVAEASSLAAAGTPRAAEVLRTVEERIAEAPSGFQRDLQRAWLSDVLMNAGAIDEALRVCERLEDDGMRLPALRRIVKAMLARGDARADALFERVEDTVMTVAPDDAEWHAALAALALAVRDADPALYAALLRDLTTRADGLDDPSSDAQTALGLARALARLGDRRFQRLFDGVFRAGTSSDDGNGMVIGQMQLRDLVEALLEAGFIPQALVVMQQLRLPDQLAFARVALADRLLDDGRIDAADEVRQSVDYEDLGEAVRSRLVAARAQRGDVQARAYFDDWVAQARELRRRFEHERASRTRARPVRAGSDT